MKRITSLILAVLMCGSLLPAAALAVEAQCEHEYETFVTAPTCTRGGYTIYICPNCGEKFTADELPALGHDFVDGVCTRCEIREYYPAVIGVGLQKQLDLMDGDVRVDVVIHLEELSQDDVFSEIAREMGKDPETLKREIRYGYTMDYVLAKRAVFNRLYGEYNSAFLAEYLPEVPAECRHYVAKTHAAFVLSLAKAEILRLADADQVVSMGYISPEEAEAIPAAEAVAEAARYEYEKMQAVYYYYAQLDNGHRVRLWDVEDETQYYFLPVYWAMANGITKGTGDGKFSPDAECTRAQIVTFLWRAAGEPEPAGTDNPFADVRETDYYYKAVLWAVEQEITRGVDERHFSPDRSCTRAEAVTFLYRAQDYEDRKHTYDSCALGDFTPNDYYYDAVLWAVENGVTTGTSEHKFSPNATCTRAQIVTFLYRALEEE